MAAGFITFDRNGAYGSRITSVTGQLKGFRHELADLLATMTQMIDGDGSDEIQFTLLVTKFGFADNDAAKAAWDELNALSGKLSGDGSVSFVNAAINQAVAKFS